MTTTDTDFRRATGDDLADVRRLLAMADLPGEDVDRQAMEDFLVLRDAEGGLLAAGGIERHARDGLLRSVVVADHARRRGLGVGITRALEAHARRSGINVLYLLTTTAADFFPRLGYVRVERGAVPPAVAASAEFVSLCPATAACLAKNLEPVA